MNYLFVLLTAIQCMQVVRAVAPEELYEQSESWPAFCHVTEPVESGQVTISSGARGVLIRIIDAGESALIDFGRQGVCVVPVAATDLQARAQGIASGGEVKRYPNAVELLGSRIVRVTGSEVERLSIDDYLAIKGFVCIRFPDTVEMWEAVAAWQHRHQETLASNGQLLLLFPEGETLMDYELFTRSQQYAMEPVAYLYAFLRESYRKILWSGVTSVSDELSYIRLNAEGRLLGAGVNALPSL